MKLTTRCPNADCRQPIILHLSRNEQKELSRRLILETTCGACGSGVRLQLANDISIISAVTTGPAARADRSLALDRETFAAAAPAPAPAATVPPPTSAAPIAAAPPPPLPAASAAAPFPPLTKVPAASSGVAPGFSPAPAMPPAPERPPAPFSPVPAAAVPDFRPIAPGPEARPASQGSEPVKVPAFAVIGADGPQRRGRSGRGAMERLTDSFSQRPKWQQYAILGLLFLGVLAILAFPTKKPPKRTPTSRAVSREAEPDGAAPRPMEPAAPGDSAAPAAGAAEGAKRDGNAEPAAPDRADGAPEKAPQ